MGSYSLHAAGCPLVAASRRRLWMVALMSYAAWAVLPFAGSSLPANPVSVSKLAMVFHANVI
jgi:hypothetical protein